MTEEVVSQKVWMKDDVIDLLYTNPSALPKAILGLYARQTADEQLVGDTVSRNGQGFNGKDAQFFSSIAKALPRYNMNLTPRQRKAALRMMRKYWKQLLQMIEEKGGQVSYKVTKAAKVSDQAVEDILDDQIDISESAFQLNSENAQPEWTL